MQASTKSYLRARSNADTKAIGLKVGDGTCAVDLCDDAGFGVAAAGSRISRGLLPVPPLHVLDIYVNRAGFEVVGYGVPDADHTNQPIGPERHIHRADLSCSPAVANKELCGGEDFHIQVVHDK